MAVHGKNSINKKSRNISKPLKCLYVLFLKIRAVWVMDVMHSAMQYHKATGGKNSL